MSSRWDNELWKCLLYGNPRVWKSYFAAQMPKPLKLFCFDPIGKEWAYLQQGTPQEMQTCEDGGMFRSVMDAHGELVVEIEYFWDKFPKRVGTQKFPCAYERFQASLEDHTNNNWKGFKSVVVDSYTFLEVAAKRLEQHKLNPGGSEWPWRNGVRDKVQDDIMSTLAWAPLHVCVIGHVDLRLIDEQAKQKWGVDAIGGLRGQLPAAFAEVYYMYETVTTEGPNQVWLMTESNGQYIAGSVIGAPNPCEPRWEALWKQ